MSDLVVFAMESVEWPGFVSIVILSSGFRTRSAFVHFTLGSGLPSTSAGKSILQPALAVKPARSFTSSWISGGSVIYNVNVNIERILTIILMDLDR